MAKDDQSKKARRVWLRVSLPEATLEAIDDYRFAKRTANRSEAVRQLLKIGQAAKPSGEQSD